MKRALECDVHVDDDADGDVDGGTLPASLLKKQKFAQHDDLSTQAIASTVLSIEDIAAAAQGIPREVVEEDKGKVDLVVAAAAIEGAPIATEALFIDSTGAPTEAAAANTDKGVNLDSSLIDRDDGHRMVISLNPIKQTQAMNEMADLATQVVILHETGKKGKDESVQPPPPISVNLVHGGAMPGSSFSLWKPQTIGTGVAFAPVESTPPVVVVVDSTAAVPMAAFDLFHHNR